ncbi:phage holin family protein [Novosphingobium album (ex Liu et al. 2023)]|uniref:Phage holin family protein n=1 Tax=Novosphingobium album (ex Liu et al. 2023) TaxID=3031130 RepID=A0ABT5WUT4_9SPHN|nr:phage holin family protein [Novosphingobium album (ex Liu et al. 2023)]MDE8653627.1 phage holin family protein [Novosphingobium album (ex Liu et al. 2023)]
MNTEPPVVAAEREDAADRSLQDDLRLLAADARAFAEAELAFQKSRAAFAGGEIRGIAILGVAAAVFLFFAVMALVVGLVIALAPVLTPWGSTAVVTCGLLAVTIGCVAVAARRWKRMMAIISIDERG